MTFTMRSDELRGWVHEIAQDRRTFVLRNASGLRRLRCTCDGRDIDVPRALHVEDVVRVRLGADGAAVEEISLIASGSRAPFTARARTSASARTRARYRYLEIRDPDVQQALRQRHVLLRAMRTVLDDNGFVGIDTPLLAVPSQSGATEFTVVSSRHARVRYALPQSPQVYGQLVMAGGVERYYQVARCFRDEDLRTDRQPEFTQLQVELAFAARDDVLALVEALVVAGCRAVGTDVSVPFRRLTHADCLRHCGTDKPDLDRIAASRLVAHRVTGTPDIGGDLIALALPHGVAVPPAWWEQTAPAAAVRGFRLLGFLPPSGCRPRYAPREIDTKDVGRALDLRSDWVNGGEAVWQGRWRSVHRLHKLIYRELGSLPRQQAAPHFAWVVDFPLFEPGAQPGELAAANHPFVAPADTDAFLAARTHRDLLALRSTSFDLVLAGSELASGSVVNHRPEVQARILDLIGQRRTQHGGGFRAVLESLRFGVPPVGGVGIGLDRLATVITGHDSIREVIAFPKSKQGQCLVTA